MNQSVKTNTNVSGCPPSHNLWAHADHQRIHLESLKCISATCTAKILWACTEWKNVKVKAKATTKSVRFSSWSGYHRCLTNTTTPNGNIKVVAFYEDVVVEGYGVTDMKEVLGVITTSNERVLSYTLPE